MLFTEFKTGHATKVFPGKQNDSPTCYRAAIYPYIH